MKRAILTRGRLVLAAVTVPMLVGCVQVAAPDKPIEINLNINIKQQVVVSLQRDVRELREQQPGIF